MLNPKIDKIKIKVEESKVISEIDYYIPARLLKVTFVTNKTWLYKDVPIEVFEAFICADSLGSFLNKNIKKNFEQSEYQDLKLQHLRTEFCKPECFEL